ncbi:MAG: porin Gram-negative type [Proteobacteria bacterium]|nr:porin Gram-negative type [Pseudomonadota bacterium]
MQKKIIALAIAGLASTAAFAQTNVTVYGIADLSQGSVRATGTNSAHAGVTRLDSNSSYIGFKGVEDLGNGLKAVFQFENNVTADTNGGLNGIRDSFVGLAGGFGTLVGGNLTHPLRAFGAKVELSPGAAGIGTMASVTGTILGIKTGADDRAANAVAYVSPSFGGVTVTGAYINGESRAYSAANGLTDQRAYQIAAQYDNGPLFVGAGYHHALDVGTNGTTLGAGNQANATVMRLAAAYTLPSATKFTVLVDKTRAQMNAITNAADAHRTAFSLGVSQGFGKNTIGLEYGRAGKVTVADSKVDSSASSVLSLLYSYDLSKRTMIHARVSRLNNQDGINTNFYNNAVANGLTNGAGTDYTGYLVGLRHAF